MSDAKPEAPILPESPARGTVRLTVVIEGPIVGENAITVTTVARATDGRLDGPETDRAMADNFVSAIMLASAELHKLGLLTGLDLVDVETRNDNAENHPVD